MIPTQAWSYGLGGAMALAFVALHWHTIKVLIPSLTAAFRAEMQAERDAHNEHIEKLLGRLEGVEKAVQALAGRNDQLGAWQHPFGGGGR